MRAVIACSLFLAGCAAQPTAEQMIAGASNIDLCETAMMAQPFVVERVMPEIQRRGLNCAEYQAAILQRQAMRGQAGVASPAPLPRAEFYPMPRQTQCTSAWVGGQLQTICR